MKNLVEPIRNKKDVEAIEKYLAKHSLRNQLIWVFGTNTGLRISDILGLNVESVKGKQYVEVIEKKTKKFKRFPLNKKLQKLIKEYLIEREKKYYSITGEEPLFVGKKHKRLHRSQVYRFINDVCGKLNISVNVGTHTMRKTFSRIWYENNKSNPNAIYVLQKMLGHKSIESTLHYICVAKEESRKFAGTMEEVFATATADDTIATYDTTSVSTDTNASTTTDDAVATYDVTSATIDGCENEDTDITNIGNAQDLRYCDNYEKQYTSLFPVGHAPTNFANPTKVGMSHKAKSSHKHITNAKLPNYIKLTRNTNVPPFPCGYNDHKLIVGHNSTVTSKLG